MRPNDGINTVQHLMLNTWKEKLRESKMFQIYDKKHLQNESPPKWILKKGLLLPPPIPPQKKTKKNVILSKYILLSVCVYYEHYASHWNEYYVKFRKHGPAILVTNQIYFDTCKLCSFNFYQCFCLFQVISTWH